MMDAQQQSRRARSSSDRAQGSPVAPPQRPRLGVRTISAPAGAIQKLDRSKGTADEGKTFQTTVIEEQESPLSSPVGNHPIDDDDVSTIKGNNEVRLEDGSTVEHHYLEDQKMLTRNIHTVIKLESQPSSCPSGRHWPQGSGQIDVRAMCAGYEAPSDLPFLCKENVAGWYSLYGPLAGDSS